MTADYRLNWRLPASPLGPARDRKPLSLTDEERKYARWYRFEHEPAYPGYVETITEKDCQQIKGEAEVPSGQDTSAETAACASPPFNVGDRVRCTYKATHFSSGVIDMVMDNYCARVKHDDGVVSGHLFEWLEHV